MVPLRGRLLVGRGHQGVALADEAAQHGVEERRRLRHPLAGGGHGLVDEGVVGVRRRVVRPQQRDGAQQQRLDGRRRRARRHEGAHGLGRAEPAQHEERQRLRAGAQRARARGQHVGERAPTAHGLHGVGGLFEQARQRRGLAAGCGASGGVRSHDGSLTSGVCCRATTRCQGGNVSERRDRMPEPVDFRAGKGLERAPRPTNCGGGAKYVT